MAEFICSTVEETQALAARLAPWLREGDCVTLQGDLGAGKTAFAKGLVAALAGISPVAVSSPTFTLVQQYDGDACPIWHCDFYRVEEEAELDELGIDEMLQQGIMVIEWPEIAAEWLPQERLSIVIEAQEGELRQIAFEATQKWEKRLDLQQWPQRKDV